MILHTELGAKPFERSRRLKLLMDKREITLAGNCRLEIYGTLGCASGKRMKPQNRVFFISEEEAVAAGYRPCGHCMHAHYAEWKECSTSIIDEIVHSKKGEFLGGQL